MLKIESASTTQAHSPSIATKNSLVAGRQIFETVHKVIELQTWGEGWDGYDAAALNHNALARALRWIRDMHYDALTTGEEWSAPHVALDEDGDIMFEWWNEDKALTIYVSEDEVSYIKGWGLNIETDMEDGEATTPERRRELWDWLMN